MDTIDVGSGPGEEHCAALGSTQYDYHVLGRLECSAYIVALKRKYGDPPDGCRLFVQRNPHDYGTYYSVACSFDETQADQRGYAWTLEAGMATWEEAGLWPPVTYDDQGGAVHVLLGPATWSREHNPECYSEDDPRWVLGAVLGNTKPLP